MYNQPSTINIENTRFIYATNLSGNPDNDRYGDGRRKANIIIPTEEQAHMLIDMGYKVRTTRPRQDDDPETFGPDYFVSVLLKYRTRNGVEVKYPPKVFLVTGKNKPQLLNEDTVGCIDNIRVKNVDVVLNQYEYDPESGKKSLYIRTMYVEQDMDDDPYAAKYAYNVEEEEPF